MDLGLQKGRITTRCQPQGHPREEYCSMKIMAILLGGLTISDFQGSFFPRAHGLGSMTINPELNYMNF